MPSHDNPEQKPRYLMTRETPSPSLANGGLWVSSDLWQFRSVRCVCSRLSESFTNKCSFSVVLTLKNIFFTGPRSLRGLLLTICYFLPCFFSPSELKVFLKGYIPYSAPLKNWANLTYVEGFFSIKKRYDRIFIIFQNLQQQYIMFLWCGDRRFNGLGIDT